MEYPFLLTLLGCTLHNFRVYLKTPGDVHEWSKCFYSNMRGGGMLNRCTMLKHPVHSFAPLSYMVMLQDFLREISHKMTIYGKGAIVHGGLSAYYTGNGLGIVTEGNNKQFTGNVSCFETYHLSLNQFDKFNLILRWGKN